MSKKVKEVECVKGQRISKAERTEGKHTAKKYGSGKVLEKAQSWKNTPEPQGKKDKTKLKQNHQLKHRREATIKAGKKEG